MFKEPIELTEEEYRLTFKCLNTHYFNVVPSDKVIETYRKSTNELVFVHFLPDEDYSDTYYQLTYLLDEEQKQPEDLPRQIILEDQAAVQQFFDEIIKIQKDMENNPREGVEE